MVNQWRLHFKPVGRLILITNIDHWHFDPDGAISKLEIENPFLDFLQLRGKGRITDLIYSQSSGFILKIANLLVDIVVMFVV